MLIPKHESLTHLGNDRYSKKNEVTSPVCIPGKRLIKFDPEDDLSQKKIKPKKLRKQVNEALRSHSNNLFVT